MTKMTPSQREYLDKLTEFWADFEPTTDAERAVQVDIPMLVEAIERADEKAEEARNIGFREGFEAARKRYERNGGVE